MALNNSLQRRTASNSRSLSRYLSQDAVKAKINEVVGGKDGQRFISAIVSATTNNSVLKECTNPSILSAALLGEALKLSPSPQLGHYYLVPFNDKEKGKVAQFQLGYKGYIQLAIRSGQYKKLNVLEIKEGELIRYDPLNEEIEINLIDDFDVRDELQTVGYYAMFELVNGFRKTLFWTKKKMTAHAVKYSQGYKKDLEKGTSYTFWSKDFDGMAFKTMLRQLISKWGIMSIDMQTAFESDMTFTDENGKRNYVDNDLDDEAITVQSNDVVETVEVEQPTHTYIVPGPQNDAARALFGGR